MANDEFSKSNCGEDEARILLASSVFKKSTRVDYVIFGAKNAFNFLWYAFTQMSIL